MRKKQLKEVPKSDEEIMLYNKYNPLLLLAEDFAILQAVAHEFRKDLAKCVVSSIYKKIVLLFLFTVYASAQSGVVTSGNENFTIGETFPIMQTVVSKSSKDTIKPPSLSVPKFDKPIKPKIKNKISTFDKIINFLKIIFNIK
jgi:hypothetical protein